MDPSEKKGYIEKIDRKNTIGIPGEGYRYSDNHNFAFIDVYWRKVPGLNRKSDDYYLIEKQERIKSLFLGKRSFTPKPISGPYPVEILEPGVSEGFVDQRCLEILKKEIKSKGLDKILEISFCCRQLELNL